MLLRFFRSNHIGLAFLMPLVVLILWSDIFGLQRTDFVPLDYQMPAYKLLMSWMPSQLVSGILALLLIILQAFYLTYINRVFNLISRSTYLPSIFFILISSAFLNLHYLHPVILANIFILLVITEVFSTYKQSKSYRAFFNAGFYVSVASLFYVNALALLLFVFISLIVIRAFNWREWIGVVLGFICPVFIAGSFLFVFDVLDDALITLNAVFDKASNKYVWPISYYVFTIILMCLALISIFKLSTTYTNNKISTRNYFSLFIFLLILLFSVFFFVPFASIELIVIGAVPMSYLLTNYYLSGGNKWVQEISLLLFILSFVFLYVQKIVSIGVISIF